MKLNVGSIVIIITFQALLLCCCCNAISWEFFDTRIFSEDVMNTIAQHISDMIDSINPDLVYPGGATLTSFMNLSLDTVIQLRLKILNRNASPDFCYISPTGGIGVRGLVLRAIWSQALYMVRNLMVLNGAKRMVVVSEMLGVEYYTEKPQSTSLSSFDDSDQSFMNSTSTFHRSTKRAPRLVAPLTRMPLDDCDQLMCWRPQDCYIYFTTLESGIFPILRKGSFLRSPNGAYLFTLETDCSLTIKVRDGGPLIWSNEKGALGADCFLLLQDDGNLVVYDSNWNVIWAANKYCEGAACSQFSAVFTVQDDRNAVLYHGYSSLQSQVALWTAVWSTETNV